MPPNHTPSVHRHSFRPSRGKFAQVFILHSSIPLINSLSFHSNHLSTCITHLLLHLPFSASSLPRLHPHTRFLPPTFPSPLLTLSSHPQPPQSSNAQSRTSSATKIRSALTPFNLMRLTPVEDTHTGTEGGAQQQRHTETLGQRQSEEEDRYK